MKRLLIFLALISPSAQARDFEQISNTIKHLHPQLYAKNIQSYANSIHNYSYQYDVEWQVVVAIFSQESGFNVKAVNWKSNDYGIGQMNYKNILRRKIDLGRLLTVSDYAIQESFKLLSEIKMRYNTNERGYWVWYTRYHSYTGKYRKKYYTKINKKLHKIKRFLNENKIRTTINRREDSNTERFDRRKIPGFHSKRTW